MNVRKKKKTTACARICDFHKLPKEYCWQYEAFHKTKDINQHKIVLLLTTIAATFKLPDNFRSNLIYAGSKSHNLLNLS